MICGQSLHALALRLARASHAGSVETCGVSVGGKRFVMSFAAGGDGVESAISTKKDEHIYFIDTYILHIDIIFLLSLHGNNCII